MSVFNLLDRVKDLEETLTCKICKHLLNDPLLVAKCGHSMCRNCFESNFNLKCPICDIPINSKDSLEDKLLKELVLQLKKLKKLLDDDSNSEKTVSVKDKTAACVSEPLEVTSANESEMKTDDDVVLEKINCVENINSAAPNFSCSTPIVRRKKKILPRSRFSTLSSGEESIVQGTPASSSKSKLMANSMRKRVSSSKSEDNNKSKSGSSLNSSMHSPNLNKKNPKGETILHRAVIKGDIAKVKELIAKGASVNTQDNNGWTPLHEASNHGFVEIAKLLLDNGALVNVPSLKDNITPLHDAIFNERIQIAILLVSRGADLHAKTALGYTALDLCKTEEDKAALIESCSPYICANVPLPSNAVHNGDSNKIVLLHTTLDDKQKEQLQKCAQLLKAEIVNDFVPEVTHIITSCDNNGNCTRTMKVLLGILTGKWIINFQWIEVCLEYKQKVDEEVFEVQGTKNSPNTQGPKQARRNLEQKFPPLFDGFYFYLHGTFYKPTPVREDLCNLIHLGGGKILSREPRENTVGSENYRLPYHASGTSIEGVNNVILYQDKPPREQHLCSGYIRTTHVMWLIECISEFKLKEFKKDDQK